MDFPNRSNFQPPSGGCVLKPMPYQDLFLRYKNQPPSGGCVLKLNNVVKNANRPVQPPSGGCVLKPLVLNRQSVSIMLPSRLQAAVC